MNETTWLDATEQADLVRCGEVSPKEPQDHLITAQDRLQAVMTHQ